MSQYDNRNRFVLFKNDDKKEDKDPDYSGTFTDEDNQEYFIDGWIGESKTSGKKMLSGRVKKKGGGSGKPQRHDL